VKKGAVWPWLIAGALGLHVAVSLIVVGFATSDPSYAVEENYYQKAVDWDKKKAQDSTNDALGWFLDFEVAPPVRPGNQPLLEVTLADAASAPLTGATVTVEAFHKARSGDILHATLTPTGEPGVYSANLPMQHNGRWELRFTVDQDGRRFTHNETRHLFVEGSWK
jgi:nitrogen fixation protein FixH